jgi:hypothetical protein
MGVRKIDATDRASDHPSPAVDGRRLKFENFGRRWAERMMGRLHASWLDVPLLWPGTHEQALTIVQALGDESLSAFERDHLAEFVQNGARLAWREMVGRA